MHRHFELAHHVVILMLDVKAVDDEFAGEVVEFHDDSDLLIRPEQDRVLPAALLIAQQPIPFRSRTRNWTKWTWLGCIQPPDLLINRP